MIDAAAYYFDTAVVLYKHHTWWSQWLLKGTIPIFTEPGMRRQEELSDPYRYHEYLCCNALS